MDVFIEYMVKKKKKISDYIEMICIAFFGVFATIILFSVLMRKAPYFGSLITLAAVAGIYFLYIWITRYNVEFEYSLVNDEMDVDKVINARKRKRMTVVNIKSVEAFGTKGDFSEFERYIQNRDIEKIYACEDKENDNVFFALYSEKDKRKMILFNPNEKMAERIKTIASRNMMV